MDSRNPEEEEPNDPTLPLQCRSCRREFSPLFDEEFDSVNWKEIFHQNRIDEDELIVHYFEKLIGKLGVCPNFKSCWRCLNTMFEVFGNEINFLESSIQIYEKKLEEGLDQVNHKNCVQELELEYSKLLEEERTLQLTIEELQECSHPTLDENFLFDCQLEEILYWKENNEFLKDIEIDKILREEMYLLKNRISASSNFFYIDFKQNTIDGYCLSIDNNCQIDSQIMNEINQGWSKCCKMLFALIQQVQSLPPPIQLYNLDGKLNLIFNGEYPQIYLNGKIYDLNLYGNNISDFTAGIKLFTQILFDFCNHVARNIPENLITPDHLPFFKEDKKLNQTILKCLVFPFDSSPNNWNFAIGRILALLKLLYWYILQIRHKSLITSNEN